MVEQNKIYLGDCLEIMKDIKDKSISAIICDLPFNKTACNWDIIVPFDKLWDQYERIIENNGVIILFGTQPFTTDVVNSNRDWFKYELIWDKQFGTDIYMARKKPLSSHENILIFYKEQPIYNPQMIQAEKKNMRNRQKNYKKGCKESIYGEQKEYIPTKDEKLRYPKDIFSYSNQAGELHKDKRLHSSQKPLVLLEWLIKSYTNEGDLVLDNCMGSGSTIVACKNTNRNYIGIEKDEQIYSIAYNRINGFIYED